MGCVQSAPPLHPAASASTADQTPAPSSTRAPTDNQSQNSATLTASGRALALPSTATNADQSNGMCTHGFAPFSALVALPRSRQKFTILKHVCCAIAHQCATCAASTLTSTPAIGVWRSPRALIARRICRCAMRMRPFTVRVVFGANPSFCIERFANLVI